MGATAAVLVEADTPRFGPADVAREIAAVVDAHAAEGRTYDLVLLGNDAADTGDFQVGIRLAYVLSRPVVNGVRSVEVDGRGRDGARRRDSTASRPTRSRCPRSSRCWRAGSNRATPHHGPHEGEEGEDRDCGATGDLRGSGRVRLTLPPAQPSTVEVLGTDRRPRPPSSTLLQRMGVTR